MNYYIRSSKRNDCYELSKTLRQQDAQEVFASGGRNPAQALIRGILDISPTLLYNNTRQ